MLALARFGADPLRFLDGLRSDDRDVVPFSLGPVHCHLLRRPEDLKAVLDDEDWPPLSRGRLMALDRWYGGGLILTEGAEHHRQRDELWKPLLADPRTPAVTAARAERLAASWFEGAPVELFGELRTLFWSIDWEALTGEAPAPEVLAALAAGTDAMQWLLGPFGRARWGWPLPSSARTRAARARLDAAIDRVIAARRAQPADDLVSRLVEREPDDDLVRATVKQWLGADQLHALVTWALYLLARHPEVTLEDPRPVIKEALRLYPPIWGFFREVSADYRLDGVTIPKGHVIALSQWVTHRDPALWSDAERFDPGRWADGARRPPDLSYFPFSAGPYECHAHHLAMTEAEVVLTALCRRWSFRPADEHPPQPTATGTIVPKGGLRMVPTARS